MGKTVDYNMLTVRVAILTIYLVVQGTFTRLIISRLKAFKKQNNISEKAIRQYKLHDDEDLENEDIRLAALMPSLYQCVEKGMNPSLSKLLGEWTVYYYYIRMDVVVFYKFMQA